MAEPDPVAAKSGFLCIYMSNHPDTLVSYVKYFGNIKGTVSTAKMTAIDTRGMDITYTSGGKDEKQVRIKFDPPLLGYEEVKPRMIGMKADAEESLGMSRAPQITGFHVASKDFYAIAPAVALLFYTTFAPASPAPVWALAIALRYLVGPTILKLSWGIFLSFHVAESLYTTHLCRKHRVGFLDGVKYVITTLCFGMAGFLQLRRVVQTERINSIMKGN